jgi:hypothetical protein
MYIGIHKAAELPSLLFRSTSKETYVRVTPPSLTCGAAEGNTSTKT